MPAHPLVNVSLTLQHLSFPDAAAHWFEQHTLDHSILLSDASEFVHYYHLMEFLTSRGYFIANDDNPDSWFSGLPNMTYSEFIDLVRIYDSHAKTNLADAFPPPPTDWPVEIIIDFGQQFSTNG